MIWLAYLFFVERTFLIGFYMLAFCGIDSEPLIAQFLVVDFCSHKGGDDIITKRNRAGSDYMCCKGSGKK
jgi:hypothetical protein